MSAEGNRRIRVQWATARARSREVAERVFGRANPEPEHDPDEVWRELVEAKRDALNARAELEALEREREP